MNTLICIHLQVKSLSDRLSQPSRCERCSKIEEPSVRTDSTDQDPPTDENGLTDHAKLVEDIKNAASEVARDQFLKVRNVHEAKFDCNDAN